MGRLVDELKHDHAELASVLDEVRKSGITSKEGLQILNSAKASLLTHLQKEDVQLYPALHKAALSNPRLKQTVEFFAKDMEKISQLALEFFRKYENGGDGMQFAKDVGALFGALQVRIQREETTLYPEFDRVEKESKQAA